jgi:hypothetical protein
LAFVLRLAAAAYSYDADILAALEIVRVWAWAQGGLFVQVVVFLTAYSAYQHVPGSLLARTPGTPNAATEIQMIYAHLCHAATTVGLPTVMLLMLNHLVAVRSDEHGHALLDPVSQLLPVLLRRGAWIIIPIALRCCYAVERYSKCLRTWSLLVLLCVARVAYLFDIAIRATAWSATTSRSDGVIAASTLWLGALTVVDRAILLIAVFSLVAATALAVGPITRTMWKRTRASANWFAERFPRIAKSACFVSFLGLALELPPWYATLVIGGGVLCYVVAELHAAGVLVQHMLLGLKYLLLTVSVVISIILNKLPQLTVTDVTTATMAWRVSSKDSTWYEQTYWYGSGLLSLAWGVGTAVATLVKPPVGVAMMGAQAVASKLVATGGVATTFGALTGAV